MKKDRLISTVLICAVSWCMVASSPAQEPKREPTVGAFLEFMAAKTRTDCAKNRNNWETRRASAPAGEQVLFEANQEICQCMDESLQRVLHELPEEKRSRRISDPSEVMPLALPAIQKCSSLQLRSLFGGQLCPAYTRAMNAQTLAVDEYCGCLKHDIDTYTDERATKVGSAVMEYLDSLGRAQREGKPLPPRPALIEPVHELSLRCAQAAPRHQPASSK